MASNFLAPILTKAINCNIGNSVFPENPKVVTVFPLDKGKPDKNDTVNFRPVSLLNTFSKFCEKLLRDQLVLGWKTISPPWYLLIQKITAHSML